MHSYKWTIFLTVFIEINSYFASFLNYDQQGLEYIPTPEG